MAIRSIEKFSCTHQIIQRGNRMAGRRHTRSSKSDQSEIARECSMKIDSAPLNQNTKYRHVIYNVKSISRSKRNGHKPCDLIWAARHNLRLIPTELGTGSSIDPKRTKLNAILAGSSKPEEIQKSATNQIIEAIGESRKLRYDYVQAIEIMISLKCDLAHETEPFFQTSVKWLEAWFGKDKVLSAVIHLDESRPHLHVLISPISNGKVNGSRLIDRQNLVKQKNAFQAEVATRFGLQLPHNQLSKIEQRQAAFQVLNHLETTQSTLLLDRAWPSIRTAIYKDPIAFLTDYGIHPDVAEYPKAMLTSTAIFTSTGKGFEHNPKK